MEKRVTYYNFAENDYLYLKANIEDKRVSNAMCSSAQDICERYLKEIIQDKADELNDTEIMKTHSIRNLRRFMSRNLPEFECNWKKVIQVDGYCFSARYPGEDSCFVDEVDVKLCWEAVVETKNAVDKFRLMREKFHEKNASTPFENMEMHKIKLQRKMGR